MWSPYALIDILWQLARFPDSPLGFHKVRQLLLAALIFSRWHVLFNVIVIKSIFWYKQVVSLSGQMSVNRNSSTTDISLEAKLIAK